jgi:hypothetical protein
MVMTGMWTQPTSTDSQVTIHPDGYCHGDKMHLVLHKGSETFRLGWPLQPGDTPEKEAPSCLVSNVGMGFEQPSTYIYMENGGRMISQAPWTPRFIRLAHYTGGNPRFRRISGLDLYRGLGSTLADQGATREISNKNKRHTPD